MKLKNLLYKVKILKIIGSIDSEISDIQFDSRKIQSKDIFIAIKGIVSDGHNHIESAIKNGATAIIVEQMPDKKNDRITYVQVEDTNESLGVISSNFYNNPSARIKIIGITGTNGKTTIVSLLYQLFTLLHNKVGMLSTIENKIGDKVIPSTHTTPDALQINYLLNEMIQYGCNYCFMEVSSHAIVQGRVYGLQFSAGVFTNITQDHLDYHKTFSEYINVKKSFFDSLNKDAFMLVNKDDKNGVKMSEGTKANKLTYSLKSLADYRCKVLESQFEGMLLQINKVDNILAVYAVAKEFGFEDYEILTNLSMLKSARGRFQFVKNKLGIVGIVDYAHTDDALKNVLLTINKIRTNTERLITIFGCGGERDKLKRSLMTKVACNLSTQVIITSDNPRSEDPEDILADMIAGLDPVQKKKVLIITDRKQAIITAGRFTNPNDIILLAGKGHEKYQEVKDKKLPFDDMEELKQSLNII